MTSTTESTETSTPPKKRTLESTLKTNRKTQQPKTLEAMKVEVDSYLSARVLDSESNHLDWWNVNHHIFIQF